MPNKSDIDLARSARALPLTRSMVELLGRMMTAIDRRVHMLMDAEEDDFEPDTCAACAGTGFILVPIEDFVIRNNDDEESAQETFAMVATPAAITATTEPDATVVPPITLGSINVDPVPAAVVSTPALDNPAAVVPAPTPTTPTIQAPAPTIPAPAPTIPAPAPTVPAPAPIVPATASTVLAPTPTAPAPVITAPTPAVAPAPAALFVPPQSQTVPGFHPLGPNYPIPPPTSAVFTDDTADRFYTVTKGIRVGVFGGWQNTSPYVQGVPGASFSRHSTISAAYTAYIQAHLRGFVTYV